MPSPPRGLRIQQQVHTLLPPSTTVCMHCVPRHHSQSSSGDHPPSDCRPVLSLLWRLSLQPPGPCMCEELVAWSKSGIGLVKGSFNRCPASRISSIEEMSGSSRNFSATAGLHTNQGWQCVYLHPPHELPEKNPS